MSETLPKFNFFGMFWTGFKNMSPLGRTLWTLVIIKLIIMFAILRPLFFQSHLSTNFSDDASRADHVASELVRDIE